MQKKGMILPSRDASVGCFGNFPTAHMQVALEMWHGSIYVL